MPLSSSTNCKAATEHRRANGHVITNGASTEKEKPCRAQKTKSTRKETNTREYDAEKLLQLGNRTVVRP